jgi:predicted nucleic acid-binding protein
MIVIDASVVLEILLGTTLGRRFGDKLYAHAGSWNVPHLLDTEVLSVLRRLVRSRQLDKERALLAVEDLGRLDLVRHGHADCTSRVWELRTTLTAYDATYLALAEALGATLVSADRGFLGVPDRRAAVEVWR